MVIVKIGALVPLTRPGWVDAGRHLLAGLELAVRDINESGGRVLDALTEQPTEWVARLAPAQSRGWQVYADFLLSAGHTRIAIAAESSVYWAAGTRILREHLAPRGGSVIELAPTAVCDALVDSRATALLLLVGHPEPAVSIVKSVRRDPRLAEIMIGAPAGQPEFAEWARLLGDDGAAIPFLRYLPERLSPLGARVERALRERLAEAPSFVAFEGYDTVAVLAEVLRSQESWPLVAVEGTRGPIRFSRTPGNGFWQWAWPPIQVVDRDPAAPGRFRILLRANDVPSLGGLDEHPALARERELDALP